MPLFLKFDNELFKNITLIIIKEYERSTNV